MIECSHSIKVNAGVQQLYEHIEKMPNKFPVFRVLERWPFLAMRVFFIGDFWSGVRMLCSPNHVRYARKRMARPLAPGDSYGPFRLVETVEGEKYFFSLDTSFFRLDAGYVLEPAAGGAVLRLDLVSANPNQLQRMYWSIVRPAHNLLARKTLRIIKEDVEKACVTAAAAAKRRQVQFLL